MENSNIIDKENKRLAIRFLDTYQDIAKYIEENNFIRIIDLQKHFNMGYGTLLYIIRQFENNGFVIEENNGYKFTGLKIGDIKELKINITYHGKDTKFLEKN